MLLKNNGVTGASRGKDEGGRMKDEFQAKSKSEKSGTRCGELKRGRRFL
jgi:hypothetical protein